MSIPFVSEADVLKILNVGELVDEIEQALIAFSSGRAVQPVRTAVPLATKNAVMFTMPARFRIAGIKVVALCPQNAARDLSTHNAVILAFDAETGVPLAVVEAEMITKFRTAAASAVATRYLIAAQPKKLALIGSGVQADSHHAVLTHMYDFEEIAVWSRNPVHAEAFANARGCIAAPSAEAAVTDADIVVVATLSTEPVLAGRWLKPGSHVNAVGAPQPHWRELDDEVMQNIVVVDSREAVAKESGDVISSGCTIAAELGEVAGGSCRIDRTRTTIFKSVGIAVEDIVAAEYALRRLKLLPAETPTAHEPAL